MITGATAVYGVIGDPVHHSLSPMIHNQIAKATGDDLVYAAFPVPEGGAEAAIRGAHALGIAGLNVTTPHKAAALAAAAKASEEARLSGGANTLKRTDNGYAAFSTDVDGVARALAARGFPIKGASVVILGAGGAAGAAAIAALRGGAASVTIANRTIENAEALAARLGGKIGCMTIQALTFAPNCDILINATSAGFGKQAEESPAPRNIFERAGVFMDAVYAPWETVALGLAKAAGVPCFNGFDMLFYQAAAAYEIWLGKTLGERLLTDLRTTCEQLFLQDK